MLSDKDHYQDLLRSYLQNDCTPQQYKDLFDYLNKNSSNRFIVEQMRSLFDELSVDSDLTPNPVWSENLRGILSEKAQISTKVVPMHRHWLVRVVAASILFFVLTGAAFYQFYIKKNFRVTEVVAKKSSDKIFPGADKAKLTLADGSVILLEDALNGTLAKQGLTNIHKVNGQVIYNAANNQSTRSSVISYNTISTPNGGQYQIVLPDGSKVWLNAASSLRFPTAFTGDIRSVELTGQGYFEIEKKSHQPFHVSINQVFIEVLGTHFDIMGYSDEIETRATLAEGSVKVISKKGTVLLSPSKQAVIKKNDQTVSVSSVDVEKVLAWKNGMIEFDGEELPYIMRQLSRWYDVEVIFSGVPSKGIYKGGIRRQAPLSKVLEILKVAGVHFIMDGKKVIVSGT